MGFYLRKSVTVGPFRFNLSKSGLGVSVGVKGLRVGFGPRGNYIRAGAHGVYYRAALGGGQENAPARAVGGGRPVGVGQDQRDLGPTTVFESPDASVMAAATPDGVVDEIRARAELFPIWLLTVPAILLGAGLSVVAPGPLPITATLLLLTLALRSRLRHRLARTTVLMYDLEPEYEETYRALVKEFDRLAHCDRAWIVNTSTLILDQKRNAGANRAVSVSRTWVQDWSPWWLVANVPTPAIGMGRQTLVFLPERLFVVSPSGVASVRYQDLSLELEQVQFVESGRAPSDGTVVGRTWAYVNKSGGPDRRFKNNPEFPILRYSRVRFGSAGGLNLYIQVSRADLGPDLKSAIAALGKASIAKSCAPGEEGSSPGVSPDDAGVRPPELVVAPKVDLSEPRWGELALAMTGLLGVMVLWGFRAPDVVANARAAYLSLRYRESPEDAMRRRREDSRRRLGQRQGPLETVRQSQAERGVASPVAAPSSVGVERIEWVENDTQRIKIKYLGDKEVGRWVFWKK